MTNIELLDSLKKMYGDNEDDAVLLTYLSAAKDVILARLYPYDQDKTEIPARLHSKQVSIANYLLNKRGAEGETAHSENGISRTYSNADIPKDMLDDIVPFCGVI